MLSTVSLPLPKTTTFNASATRSVSSPSLDTALDREPSRHRNFEEIPGSYDSDDDSDDDQREQKKQLPITRQIPIENRPNFVPYRSKSTNLQAPKLNKFEIDSKIFTYLCSKQKPIKPGYIYVLESPKCAPSHVKIGRSKGDPNIRLRKWIRECRIPLTKIENKDPDAFDHHGIVETLLSLEFHNERKRYYCRSCLHDHEEWYEIDAEKALKALRKWKKWLIEQRPYNKQGELTPYWRWKVDRLHKELSKVDWEEWTNPWRFDHWLFQLELLVSRWERFDRILRAEFARKDHRFWVVGLVTCLILCIARGVIDVLGFLVVLLML